MQIDRPGKDRRERRKKETKKWKRKEREGKKKGKKGKRGKRERQGGLSSQRGLSNLPTPVDLLSNFFFFFLTIFFSNALPKRWGARKNSRYLWSQMCAPSLRLYSHRPNKMWYIGIHSQRMEELAYATFLELLFGRGGWLFSEPLVS